MNIRTHRQPSIATRLPTGGALNHINEKHKCNSRHHTVPVMELVKHHRPTTPERLRELIECHYRQPSLCEVCKCVSMGTVEQFASRLYEAQYKESDTQEVTPLQKTKTKNRHTWDECYRFHYTLFCIAPLRGLAMEQTYQKQLYTALQQHRTARSQTSAKWIVREATQQEDFDCAVDLVVEWRSSHAQHASSHTQDHTPSRPSHISRIVQGLQIKPESVLRRHSVIQQNVKKHMRFCAPVIFVVYNSRGEWQPTAVALAENLVKAKPKKKRIKIK